MKETGNDEMSVIQVRNCVLIISLFTLNIYLWFNPKDYITYAEKNGVIMKISKEFCSIQIEAF